MKYFVIAGEASGDLHAAHLLGALQQCDPQAIFIGLGGDRMAAAGCRLLRHYRQMAFMGIVAVLRNLNLVSENFRIAKQALLDEQPDVLVLVDYPSFNLRMAAFARRHLPAIRIVYYIPPKAWAWKRWRVHRIAQLSDAVLGIFPFEPAFYRQYGYACQYVGNPTMDAVREWKKAHPQIERTPRQIAILPGSRQSEIAHCLQKMLTAARRIEGAHIVVAAAPSIDDAYYRPFLLKGETLTRDTYSLLASSEVALVNSGTATLEAALLDCPQAAVYHIACPHLAALIWKAIFTIRHFTLVNILADKRDTKGQHIEVIRELIAHLFTIPNMEAELNHLLSDTAYQQNMLAEYEHIRSILGNQPAAESAADAIMRLVSKHGDSQAGQ
ncbi:MAG: lipid-A-disaccharide synthase [Paludibacteraceae bacterium]|nr:lipid-A-disaccharide synthase [Paludibacteraceae bacterium]